LPPADLRKQDFRKILLIKLSAVGDVVHTIPVLNKLRRRYPAAQLDWLVTSPIAELLRHNPSITNIIEFERDVWSTPWRLAPFAAYARLAARLRAAAYDLVVDMHGQFRTAALTLATGAPARIGFDRPRARVWGASPRKFPLEARRHAWQGAREGSWLAYTHHIAVPTLDLHAVDRYLNLGSILELDKGPADFSFPIPQSANSRVDSLLRQHHIDRADLVVMAPGTVWGTKHWGTEKFAKVAQHFLSQGFAVVLIGTQRERNVCEEVADLAPGAVDLAGMTTLSELAALIRRAALNITNDSGPMHLAVALNRPVISIFGPTDPVWIGPYGRQHAVLHADLPCSPCYLRQLKDCGRSASAPPKI
jgi:lipopolysaccharide heptosyltransferase I